MSFSPEPNIEKGKRNFELNISTNQNESPIKSAKSTGEDSSDYESSDDFDEKDGFSRKKKKLTIFGVQIKRPYTFMQWLALPMLSWGTVMIGAYMNT